MASRIEQLDLFARGPQAAGEPARPEARDLSVKGSELPEGFVYQPELLTTAEESALLEIVRALPLEEATYKEYTAKRRTVSYGGKYDYKRNVLNPAAPIPQSLFALRDKVASWVGIPAEKFVHGLVTEYRPGTPLGWHRDVPDFEAIVGVSLGGAARMKLRPYKPGERNFVKDVIALDLAPRSAYSIRGNARWAWQHSIVATKALRYSITFRTSRK